MRPTFRKPESRVPGTVVSFGAMLLRRRRKWHREEDEETRAAMCATTFHLPPVGRRITRIRASHKGRGPRRHYAVIWGRSQRIKRLAARLSRHGRGMGWNQGTIASDGSALNSGELELLAWSMEHGAWSMERGARSGAWSIGWQAGAAET